MSGDIKVITTIHFIKTNINNGIAFKKHSILINYIFLNEFHDLKRGNINQNKIIFLPYQVNVP